MTSTAVWFLYSEQANLLTFVMIQCKSFCRNWLCTNSVWCVCVCVFFLNPKLPFSPLYKWLCKLSLREHAYSYIYKKFNSINCFVFFLTKNANIFLISPQSIDCGGSNEYPQSMFLSRNKKIMYTPVNPSFTI